MRLHGWQRIGIVLTALWVLGAGGVTLFRELKNADQQAIIAQKLCYENMRADDDCTLSYDETIGGYQEVAYIQTALVGVLPIPFAWLIAWAGAGIYRKVRRQPAAP